MKWEQVTSRRGRARPTGKDYRKWKPDVAVDCHHRCVYCALPESFAGHPIRNFTLDHFRPVFRFAQLELRIWNLYLCCNVCNTYKNDDWPGEVTNVFSECVERDVVGTGDVHRLELTTGADIENSQGRVFSHQLPELLGADRVSLRKGRGHRCSNSLESMVTA